ncbi:MAG TPA: PAS domain S-box protein [Acidobacteriaceae bacterium]|jgi:PAS domain S-box-containing protein
MVDVDPLDDKYTDSSKAESFVDSTALLEAIVRSSEDVIITKDLSGRITSWNPAASRLFGYAPEEILGKSILTLIPERLRYEEPEIIRRLRAGEQIEHYETIRVSKEGQEITVSLTISPLKNGRDEVVGASKILRDITERKQHDETRFQLAAIVESSDDAILSKDLTGRITNWNRAAERLFGYAPDEIIGQSVLLLIPPELHSEEQAILEKIRAGDHVEHYETVRMRRDGGRLDVSLTVSPIKDRTGAVIGASKIVRNISDRKRMERSLLQAEKLAASGRMAATIAHEINNPLEAILNLIYLAKANSTDPEQVESYLGTAESELIRLTHIAKQTLGFYRETAQAKYISLAAIVEDALRIYGPRLIHANVALETTIDSRRLLPMKHGEIMQVISNLLSNAIAAMPKGGRLNVRVQDLVDQERDGVLFAVEDTGTGIEEENMKKIFEPFFTTREAVGTGIGLWVAQQFVEGHGGTIHAQSSTDQATHGTTMSVFLPVENAYSKDLPAHQDGTQIQ